MPRKLDVILKFIIDPKQAEFLAPLGGENSDALRWRVAYGPDGDTWVRITGEIPAGTGTIGSFPVRVLQGEKAEGVLGTLTLYYPVE